MERNNFLNLKPMLLKEVYKPFNDKDYIFELKFDGIRCLVLINNDDLIIRSRNGVILNNIYKCKYYQLIKRNINLRGHTY